MRRWCATATSSPRAHRAICRSSPGCCWTESRPTTWPEGVGARSAGLKEHRILRDHRSLLSRQTQAVERLNHAASHLRGQVGIDDHRPTDAAVRVDQEAHVDATCQLRVARPSRLVAQLEVTGVAAHGGPNELRVDVVAGLAEMGDGLWGLGLLTASARERRPDGEACGRALERDASEVPMLTNTH